MYSPPRAADGFVIGPDPARGRRPVRWLAAITGVLVVVPIAAVLVAGTLLYARTELPALPRLAETTRLTDRSGRPLATLHSEVDRVAIPLEHMPRHLRSAVIAAEDAGFYEHPGVDPGALARALWTDLRAGAFVEGGSTITQQYVKNVFTGAERTLERKAREAVLAVKLEREVGKDGVLERYLNTVYFGHGAYGVEAAARRYFGVHAWELRPQQSAMLAGLVASPGRFDPVTHPIASRVRTRYVLDRMVVTGALTAAAARRLGRAPLHMVVGRMPSVRAPYFVEEVRRFLQLRYGPEAAYAGGLRVSTTIDLAWQRSAEHAIAAHLASSGDPAAALVAIDPRTGAIRAMVGGADFDRVKLNLATQAHRQAGSAFKPFALIAALEAGYSPSSTWSAPAWTVVPDSRCETAGEAWSVTNASGHGYGELSLADATTWSVNTVYAQVTMAVMPEAVVDVAHRLGIGSPLEPVCSIALGTQDVTPLEMTSAYATLAAGGVHHAPATVAVVRDADGAVVDRPVDVVGRLAVDPNDAAVATGVLQEVVAKGTGRGAALPERPVAGKTGTAESSTDAWFCGYIPQLATCVWVGHPEGSRPMPGVHGGSIPASIWHDFMATVTDGMPVAAFADGTLDTYAVPAGVAPTLPTQPAAPA